MPETPKDTRFKPGQSGNPAGRRKGSKSFAGAMKRLMKAQAVDITYHINGKKVVKKFKIDGDSENFYDAICTKQLEMAIAGDQKSQDSIINRMEGTPTQSINMKQELSGGLEVALKRRVINSKADIKKTVRVNPLENGAVETVTEIVTKNTDYDADEVF